jgi:PAS domain S-box-containing protein
MEKSLNVLVVEDSERTEQVEQILQSAGIKSRVTTSNSPQEGFKMLLKGQFDCVLVEYDLPLGGGLRFIKEVRDQKIAIPIIVFNIEEKEQIVMDMMKSGASDYIIKGLMTSMSITQVIRRSLEMQQIQEAIILEKETLEESELRYMKIIQSAPYGIVTFDENNKIQDWNPKAEEIFGYTKEEMVGEDLLEQIIPQQYRDRHKDVFKKFYSTDDKSLFTDLYEVTACRKDEGEFPVELKFTEIKVKGIVLVVAFIRDLSLEKAQEKELSLKTRELVRSNKELESFAYIASHDLKEPLRMITSFSNLLEKDTGGELSTNAKEYLKYVLEGSERMKTLIDALLEYSRIGRNNNYHKTDINDVVDLALNNLQALIRNKNADIECDRLPVIEADAAQIERLFQNLIGNALKFTDKKYPEIRIKCKKAGKDGYEFEVRDNGIGIPEDGYDRVFVPFQRLQPREAYEGTGIGLAACKKIVENHQGSIWVDSEPGIRTSFYFTLPARHLSTDKKSPSLDGSKTSTKA